MENQITMQLNKYNKKTIRRDLICYTLLQSFHEKMISRMMLSPLRYI